MEINIIPSSESCWGIKWNNPCITQCLAHHGQYPNESVFLEARMFGHTISCTSVKWTSWGGSVAGSPHSGWDGCLFILQCFENSWANPYFPNAKAQNYVFCTLTPQEKNNFSLIKQKLEVSSWPNMYTILWFHIKFETVFNTL